MPTVHSLAHKQLSLPHPLPGEDNVVRFDPETKTAEVSQAVADVLAQSFAGTVTIMPDDKSDTDTEADEPEYKPAPTPRKKKTEPDPNPDNEPVGKRGDTPDSSVNKDAAAKKAAKQAK